MSIDVPVNDVEASDATWALLLAIVWLKLLIEAWLRDLN